MTAKFISLGEHCFCGWYFFSFVRILLSDILSRYYSLWTSYMNVTIPWNMAEWLCMRKQSIPDHFSPPTRPWNEATWVPSAKCNYEILYTVGPAHVTKTVAHANNQTLLLFLWKSLGKRLKTNWVNQRGEREGVGGKEDKRGERQRVREESWRGGREGIGGGDNRKWRREGEIVYFLWFHDSWLLYQWCHVCLAPRAPWRGQQCSCHRATKLWCRISKWYVSKESTFYVILPNVVWHKIKKSEKAMWGWSFQYNLCNTVLSQAKCPTVHCPQLLTVLWFWGVLCVTAHHAKIA